MANNYIYCDDCKKTISLDGLIREHVIGNDESGPIKEKFFECPNCGKHYTITVYNRRMALKIQKRKQLQVKIKRAWGRKSDAQRFRTWVNEDERLKNELLTEAHQLREKYLNKGE